MKYKISNDGSFPIVYLNLLQSENIRIESGSMVYHNGQVKLEGKMNSNGSKGISGAFKAVSRSLVSNEGFFITVVEGLTNDGFIGIAPNSVGQIKELSIGSQQWFINDGSFLASDMSVSYKMVRQSLSKAIFAGSGGFFIMQTSGNGSVLVNGSGDIIEVQLDGTTPLIVDNYHVVAWESSLNYHIKVASGVFGVTTGEGIVNHFEGVGKVLIQTRSRYGTFQSIAPFIPASK